MLHFPHAGSNSVVHRGNTGPQPLTSPGHACPYTLSWCQHPPSCYALFIVALALLALQVSMDDQRMMQDIQRFYNTMIEELPSNVADLI
eukprot:1141970-Pelagomonas_calceolata.AAC.13